MLALAATNGTTTPPPYNPYPYPVPLPTAQQRDSLKRTFDLAANQLSQGQSYVYASYAAQGAGSLMSGAYVLMGLAPQFAGLANQLIAAANAVTAQCPTPNAPTYVPAVSSAMAMAQAAASAVAALPVQ